MNKERHLFGCGFLLAVLLSLSQAAFSGEIICVDDSATGANDGSSWEDAYIHLQDALMVASAGDEIHVAQGTYRPDQFVLSKRPNLGRQETFQLKNGVAVFGGYGGLHSDYPYYPDWRNIDKFKTILSGDLNGDDADKWQNRTDNSRHVVSAVGVDETAVLDGVTVTSGCADGVDGDWPLINSGAGLYAENASPTIRNCAFTQNLALIHDSEYEGNGAGVYFKEGSPKVQDCRFIANKAEGTGAGMFSTIGSPQIDGCEFLENTGGGLACSRKGSPIVTDSYFASNTAGFGAGANFEYGSNPLIQNCRFVNNLGARDGGALRLYVECKATVVNCLFSGNSAKWQSGAGAALYKSNAEIINCTFAFNTAAKQGGALYCIRDSNATVTNCIMWANSAETSGDQIALEYHTSAGTETAGSTVTVSFSDIEGGRQAVLVDEGCQLLWLEGNIDVEPKFVAPGEEYFHLLPNSPCIDAGDNCAAEPYATDLDGNARIINGRVDMGAYESSHIRTKVLYVDDDATGAANGSSWTDAFVNLQNALAEAKPGDEIRVAQGTYTPAEPNGDRDKTFTIPHSTKLLGGYAGVHESDPDIRDIKRYETILSGDLNGDDVGGLDNPSRNDNSRHVVTIGQPYWSQVHITLDGFAIAAGHATGPGWDNNGAGLHSTNANYCVIENCTFTHNWAENDGGALYDLGSCHWKLENCIFTDNGAGSTGGALYLDAESMPDVTNCLFAHNRAACGGAIANIEAYFTLANCTVANNHATQCGGGMYDRNGTGILNCIFWGNTDCDGDAEHSQVSSISSERQNMLDYCCVQGWSGVGGGVGNFGDDPLFVDPERGDYHLKSQAGHFNDRNRLWTSDEVTSPCIDAGDTASPIGMEAFPNGGIVNIGVYGGTEQASKSWFGKPCRTVISGDINGDCRVDLVDLSFLAMHWLESVQEFTVDYKVGPCQGITRRDDSDELRFTVRVEGSYIYFEDMIRANCCADLIRLNVQAWREYIDIVEVEYTTEPCRCMCDYPVTAVMGPLEPGTYELSVGHSTNNDGYYVGITEVVIP